MSLLGHQAVTTLTAEERQVSAAIAKIAAPMLRSDPQVVHFPALAKAALETMARLPRIPRWRGPRTVTADPHVEVGVDLAALGGDGHDRDVVMIFACVGGERASIALAPKEARPFFLAGLAACAAAEDPAMIDPDATSDGMPGTPDAPAGSGTCSPGSTGD